MEAQPAGKPAFDQVHGKGVFEFFAENKAASTIFDRAMTSHSSGEIDAILAAYDFSSCGKVADVAGGNGTLLAAILGKFPSLRGVLFDRAHVVSGAKAVRGPGIAERCEVVSGDFFESVPAADTHLLKHIIHDWDDERCLKILGACRKASGGKGKLLLVEMIVPLGNGPAVGKLLDLEMLVMTPGGRERTEAEYRALLGKAGYRLTRIVPTPGPVSILEGAAV